MLVSKGLKLEQEHEYCFWIKERYINTSFFQLSLKYYIFSQQFAIVMTSCMRRVPSCWQNKAVALFIGGIKISLSFLRIKEEFAHPAETQFRTYFNIWFVDSHYSWHKWQGLLWSEQFWLSPSSSLRRCFFGVDSFLGFSVQERKVTNQNLHLWKSHAFLTGTALSLESRSYCHSNIVSCYLFMLLEGGKYI